MTALVLAALALLALAAWAALVDQVLRWVPRPRRPRGRD